MKKILFLGIFIAGIVAVFHVPASAQVQTVPFSGGNKSSYQCFSGTGQPTEPTDQRDSSGYWLCPCNSDTDGDGNGDVPFNGRCPGSSTCTDPDNPNSTGAPGDPGCLPVRSVPKPPTLQQIEIWFVRIIYIVWTLVATLSFFYLVVLGYRYMITRGDVTKITEIRQKIIYYFVGFIIIFLAIPILSTVFRLLGVNSNVDCYNVNLGEIGFQFFFTDLCTAPNLDYYCVNPESFREGLACGSEGEVHNCGSGSIQFVCSRGVGGERLTWLIYYDLTRPPDGANR
jgi:hypothetical protein